MARLQKKWYVFFLTTLLISCFDPPNYSVVPSIKFESIEFVDVEDPFNVDSLQINISFTDGDGDLGLDPSEVNYPYHEKTYFYLDDNSYVTYETKRTNPNYDTLPSFVSPYYCINWEIVSYNDKIDTLYFQSNPNQYNIFVEFFLKNQDGTYDLFDWQEEFASFPSCGESFNGRFPILSKDIDLSKPLDGYLQYSMNSVGFLALFSIKTLKLRITIQDRNLNRSNTIDTGDFTLQQIMKG